jgi:hypothetical protein
MIEAYTTLLAVTLWKDSLTGGQISCLTSSKGGLIALGGLKRRFRQGMKGNWDQVECLQRALRQLEASSGFPLQHTYCPAAKNAFARNLSDPGKRADLGAGVKEQIDEAERRLMSLGMIKTSVKMESPTTTEC